MGQVRPGLLLGESAALSGLLGGVVVLAVAGHGSSGGHASRVATGGADGNLTDGSGPALVAWRCSPDRMVAQVTLLAPYLTDVPLPRGHQSGSGTSTQPDAGSIATATRRFHPSHLRCKG